MTRSFQAYDGVACAEVAVYSFFLIGGIFLCIKHGFGQSAGWRYLIILALARLIGGSLRLATLSDPTNVSLYIGWMTLNGLGFGPLVLMLIGLLTRVFESINRHREIVKPIYSRLVQLLMVVAMILLIVGGTKSTYHIVDNKPKVDYATLSHVGTGIMVAVTVILCLALFVAFQNQGYIGQGEHRIVLACIVCMPFVIVRLAYSCLLVFGGITSSAFLMLGMSSLMEMAVSLICQVLGFTLGKAQPKTVDPESEGHVRGKMERHVRRP